MHKPQSNGPGSDHTPEHEAEVNDDLVLNMWHSPDGWVCMIEDPVENCSRTVDYNVLIGTEDAR